MTEQQIDMRVLETRYSPYIIIGSAIFSLMWGLVNVLKIKNVKMTSEVVQVAKINQEELVSMKESGKVPP